MGHKRGGGASTCSNGTGFFWHMRLLRHLIKVRQPRCRWERRTAGAGRSLYRDSTHSPHTQPIYPSTYADSNAFRSTRFRGAEPELNSIFGVQDAFFASWTTKQPILGASTRNRRPKSASSSSGADLICRANDRSHGDGRHRCATFRLFSHAGGISSTHA